ncbi:MAG: cation transporter [Thermoanaerobaculia bacterium]
MNSKIAKMLPVVAALIVVLGVAVWSGPRLFAGDESNQDVATAKFEVDGMTCGGCEVAVRRSVKKLDGIETVEASHKEGTAIVTYHPEEVTTDQIADAIRSLGYQAELESDDGEEM